MSKCLGEIAYITKLAGFEHTNYIQGNCTHTKATETDVPLFIGKTVRDGKIDTDFDWYIPKSISDGLERSKLTKKCLVLPYVGTLGDMAIFDGSYPAHLGSNIAKIELNPNCGYSEEFIYYFLKSPYGQSLLLRDMQGAVQKNITMEAIRKVELPDISIEHQAKVVSVLKMLDDKIKNNNAINTELEAIAKTIYDYWFLQFEFPDENGKPYKSSGGKMIWNEELKREIPEKFKVEDILSMCHVVDCLHSQKPSYLFEDEKYYLLTLENLLKDGTIDLSEKFYISKKDYEEWTSRIEVRENDFVVTNAGRAGDICKLPRNVKCAIGRNITAIRPTEIDPYYLRCFFKSNYLREQILGNLDCGAFFMSFNVKSIKKLKILVPSQTVFDNFIEKVKPIILQIEENIIQNQELASLRDFLLPLLMNGQVTFKED